MNKSGSNKNRAMSASFYSDKKQRGINSKIQHKKFGRTFTETNNSDFNFKGKRGRFYTSVGEQFNKASERVGRAPEELAQENFILKNQLNDLNNKLNLTKSKIESQKKKHLIYSKKLNREFQKQLYWQNDKQNQYLITGIKSQYQKLKQSYQQKCKQFQTLKMTITSTQMQELSKYCESLEEQNKILLENITFLKSKKRSTNLQNYLSPVTKMSSYDIQSILKEYQQKQLRYKAKIKKLEEESYDHFNKQSELIKKIDFLQKLMIEKQNDSHHSRKKLKMVQKQNSRLIKEIKVLQQKILQNEKKNEINTEQIKAQNQRQSKIQKTMFQKVIKEKNVMIEKLQKQIGYLSTLLTHWKPLDDLDKFDRIEGSSTFKDKSSSVQNQSINMQALPSRQIQGKTKTQSNLVFPQESNNEERYMIKSIHNQEFVNKDNSFLTINRSEQVNRFDENSNRLPRRSGKKWTQEAKKCRKVQLNQVDYLGELIKFKMIAHGKSQIDMKDYFSCKLQRSNSSKLEEDLITMKQVKQTLMNVPFQLTEEQAHLLSRYIIEDEGNQFVFSHQANQLERPIAKSILKSLTGDYQLPNYESCEAKWKQIKRMYSHNMQLVFKSVCPKGTITKDKFLQIFRSLGIQIDDETKNFVIGKLVQSENSLSSLKYDILFTAQQRIE